MDQFRSIIAIIFFLFQGSRQHVWEIKNASSVYTWQDGRCTADFLSELPVPDSHLRLSSGYGCATLFWFLRNQPEFFNEYDRYLINQHQHITQLEDQN